MLLAVPAAANAATTIYMSSEAAGRRAPPAVGSSGGLTPLAGSPIASGTESSGSATTPDGRHLYVAAGAVNGIRGYDVNANGTFTPIAGEPFGSSGDNRALAISADGRFLFAVLEALEVYSIGPVGGAHLRRRLRPRGLRRRDRGRHPGHAVRLRVQPVTGLVGLAIAGDGSLSPIAVPDPGNIPFGLSMSPDGRFLFVGRAASNAISGYRIGADGSLTLVNTVAGAGPAAQIAVAPNGRSLYAYEPRGRHGHRLVDGRGRHAQRPARFAVFGRRRDRWSRRDAGFANRIRPVGSHLRHSLRVFGKSRPSSPRTGSNFPGRSRASCLHFPPLRGCAGFVRQEPRTRSSCSQERFGGENWCAS